MCAIAKAKDQKNLSDEQWERLKEEGRAEEEEIAKAMILNGRPKKI